MTPKWYSQCFHGHRWTLEEGQEIGVTSCACVAEECQDQALLQGSVQTVNRAVVSATHTTFLFFVLVILLPKMSWSALHFLSTGRLDIWFCNPTPGHIFGENSNSERYMHPDVHSSTVYSSQDVEATIMSIDRWMDKEDVVCILSVILLSHKKQWNNAIFSTMDGPRDYHTKWSMSDEDKYHILLLCRIKNMIQINLFTKWKQIHKEKTNL